MAGDVELVEAELLHDFELVARHRALGIRFVVGAGFGLAAAAVTAQVRANYRVVFGEARRDLRPHRVGLGKAVQQQERWARAAMAQADGDFVGLDCCQRESIEHDTLVTGHSRVAMTWKRRATRSPSSSTRVSMCSPGSMSNDCW